MEIKALVSQMTLEEKAGLCSGLDFWHTKSVERLGVPSVMVSDGPHGLRKQDDKGDHLGINDSIKAVCMPAASATAASFDRDLIRKMGEAIGDSCQHEKLSVVLGPAVNIKRSPLCGRNFEYFSEQAAEYTGINVKKVIFLVFVISGFMASMAGILTCTRTYSGQPNVGNGAEMDAISAVVLGGTSMTGGVGTIGGTVIGCLVIGFMNNGMNLMGIDSSWQYVVKGIVVLLAVFIDYVKKENKFSAVKAKFLHKK